MWSTSVRLQTVFTTVFTAAAAGVIGLFAMPCEAQAQVPSGSYTQSCRNEYVGRDGVLHAECRTVRGSWQRASIASGECRNRDIINLNGQLVCGDRVARSSQNGSWGRGDRRRDNGGVTLFVDRRFRGRNMFIGQDYSNLGNTGFNDVASSLRIQGRGTWRVCSDKNYGGRCVDVSSDVSELSRIGLGNNISSIKRIN